MLKYELLFLPSMGFSSNRYISGIENKKLIIQADITKILALRPKNIYISKHKHIHKSWKIH